MVQTDIHFDPENQQIVIRNLDETGAVIPTLPQIRLTLTDLMYADQVGSEPIEMICRRMHYSGKRCYGLFTIPEDDGSDDGHSDAVEDVYIKGPQRFRVKGVYSSYLVCRTWDGTTEGTSDVYVAKPPHLRWYPSSWPGMTIVGDSVTFTHSVLADYIDGQRTAHDVTDSSKPDQVEIIVPVWQWGTNDTGSGTGVLGSYDEIWADQPQGGTGVTTITETAYDGAAAPAEAGKVLTWMDDNRNDRFWFLIG